MWSEIYRIEGPWPGWLAIVPRPRGGDWLGDEIAAWRKADIDLVVSALTAEEISHLELDDEGKLCKAKGIEFVSFPIPDRRLPESATDALELARRLEARLRAGTRVAIHCRQGIGRSAILAALVLAAAGVDAETAFERIGAARKCPVPDTPAQREWVVRLVRDLARAGDK
jgi:protein-tyrosine phosphatase